MQDDLRKNALHYHRYPTPGKIEISPTKPLATQADLALAYSPGVAAACEAIVENPAEARHLTARANLVGVITNGTAVLGLGAIGPLAAKPVMEGKAVLFKKFAGIDCFDIELNETNVDKLVDAIAAMEPTFGGINLEDIKAPECFEVERRLRERLKIPVFHDDQHGTAIIVGAALLNGLHVVGKKINEVKLVTSGAGAAALSCLDMMVALGVPRKNIYVTDLAGVVYTGRVELMDPNKARYCQDTTARTLAEVIPDADIFLGLSAGGVLKPEMVKAMAARPLIFALANPDPEILPADVRAVRSDAITDTPPYTKGDSSRADCPSTSVASTSACCTASTPAIVAGPVVPPMTHDVMHTGCPSRAQRSSIRAVSPEIWSGAVVLSTIKARGRTCQSAPKRISLMRSASSTSSSTEATHSIALSLAVRRAWVPRRVRSASGRSSGSMQSLLKSIAGSW